MTECEAARHTVSTAKERERAKANGQLTCLFYCR